MTDNRPFRYFRMLPAFVCTLLLVAFFSVASADDSDPRPVIVLTGFEPFGTERPPNPSWESIKGLNGREWQKYRLVAAELPVVWGTPMIQLRQLIEKHSPVAVFSFGQGYAGAFAVETVANNRRAAIPDNRGELPELTQISSDGPEVYDTTFPFAMVANSLRTRGFPVRISREAGDYLCEETLYSLEHIRASSKNSPVVAFCHVPPLGTTLTDGRVADRALIQQFIESFLEAWRTVHAAPKLDKTIPAVLPNPAAMVPMNSEEERGVVEELIVEYFKSWSEQRMDDYGDCFADGAVIQEVGSGRVNTQLKDPFVKGQRNYHQTAIWKAVEVPVRTAITMEADLARVVVYWKLSAGPRQQYGYDHFTLMKQKGKWKIINLVFYSVRNGK